MVTPVHEIRFHGRGGQGTVSAAALLSIAAFEDGLEAQAFPKYGAERRGAPVEAYVRISDRGIRTHNQVYMPNVVVIQDPTLLRSQPVLAGLKDGGLVVLNAEGVPDERDESLHWVVLPASRIGQETLGRPLPNTVLLGAVAAATGWVSLEALQRAIGQQFAGKGEDVVAGNVEALRRGYQTVVESAGERTS